MDVQQEKGKEVKFSVDDFAACQSVRHPLPFAFALHPISLFGLKLPSRRTTSWDGVRNHQAKNFMRARSPRPLRLLSRSDLLGPFADLGPSLSQDDMKLGHKVLFYHSNTKVPGVYGLAEVRCPPSLSPLLPLIHLARSARPGPRRLIIAFDLSRPMSPLRSARRAIPTVRLHLRSHLRPARST